MSRLTLISIPCLKFQAIMWLFYCEVTGFTKNVWSNGRKLQIQVRFLKTGPWVKKRIRENEKWFQLLSRKCALRPLKNFHEDKTNKKKIWILKVRTLTLKVRKTLNGSNPFLYPIVSWGRRWWIHLYVWLIFTL